MRDTTAEEEDGKILLCDQRDTWLPSHFDVIWDLNCRPLIFYDMKITSSRQVTIVTRIPNHRLSLGSSRFTLEECVTSPKGVREGGYCLVGHRRAICRSPTSVVLLRKLASIIVEQIAKPNSTSRECCSLTFSSIVVTIYDSMQEYNSLSESLNLHIN